MLKPGRFILKLLAVEQHVAFVCEERMHFASAGRMEPSRFVVSKLFEKLGLGLLYERCEGNLSVEWNYGAETRPLLGRGERLIRHVLEH